MNKLILGDNLEILKTIESETIDLIYLDPPFFSNRDYEVIWGDDGEVRSFQDRWAGGIDHYIAWLKERVVEMHRILKPTGSIFLHCDWHADAYIRVEILDKLFGRNKFLNAIDWCYNVGGKSKRYFARKKDTIFWYAKSNQWVFNPEQIGIKRDTGTKSQGGKMGIDDNGRPYQDKIVKATKKVYRYYLDEDKIPEDWWVDINSIQSGSDERIGYPTQKPMALLERIIKCASNEGDLILDPFMGGGTTLAVADKLNRKWIGIDQSVQAVKVTELRLNAQTDIFTSLYADSYSLQLHKYDYDTLRNKDAFEFENWIIGQFGGNANAKQHSDLGLDGKMPDNTPIQVKRSDNVGRNVIDNFKSAIERSDKALRKKNIAAHKPIGYLIAFSFSKGAVQEVARLKNQEDTIIKLVAVEDIIPVSKKPGITIDINEIARDGSGARDIEFIATGKSSVGIEFYSWDFDYLPEKGFRASFIRDTKGKQQHKLKAGIHNIAVKVVDNDGLEGMEVIKLKVNGVLERTY